MILIFGDSASVPSAVGWDFFKLSMWDLVWITRGDFITHFSSVYCSWDIGERENLNKGNKTLSCIEWLLILSPMLLISWTHIILCFIPFKYTPISNLSTVCFRSPPSDSFSLRCYCTHTIIHAGRKQCKICQTYTLSLHLSLSVSACLSHTHSHKTSLPEPNCISTRWMTHNCIFVVC